MSELTVKLSIFKRLTILLALKILLIILLFPFFVMSAREYVEVGGNNEGLPKRWIDYEHKITPGGYEYFDRSCSKDCKQGGCRYEGCGFPNPSNGTHIIPVASCKGGLCEFTNCKNATCDGGACTYIQSTGSTCSGGGCHFVHPMDVLKEGYCSGGGCKLNGRRIPSILRNRLTI